jgi:23S rRNA (uracil-5-)-methyltransferase RumA
MKPIETHLITVKKLGINGEGIGYYKKMPVFIDGALPGEEVIAEITHKADRFMKGKAVRIKKKSAQRVTPFCPIFHQCGGCQVQHLSIHGQHHEKINLVKESLLKYAGLKLPDFKVEPVDTGFKDRFYRHKAQMPLVMTRSGIMTALYQKDSRTPVPMKTCPVHHPIINEVNQKVIDILNQYDLDPFDPRLKKGLLRTLITRVSSSTEEVQVTLVVTMFHPSLKEIARVIQAIESVKSVAISKLYEANTHEIFGETVEVLAGDLTITEHIDDVSFKLAPQSFYQLNPPVAHAIYQHVASKIGPVDLAVDLYTGSGTLALKLAKTAKKVIGVDLSLASIESAKANAKDNLMRHVVFLKDKAHEGLKYMLKKDTPEVITFDPPRSGLDDKTLHMLTLSNVPTLVYISCNPSTLGKNLNTLKKQYAIESLKVYDMFPHTAHVETVVVLRKHSVA